MKSVKNFFWNDILVLKCIWPEKEWTQNIFDYNKLWDQKLFSLKKCLVKYYRFKNILGQKNFWAQKYFWKLVGWWGIPT